MTKEDYDKLFGDMSFDFLSLTKQQNPVKFEKLVMNEIYSDQLILDRDPSKAKTHVFPYITKYNYLLFHLEEMEQYERCAVIKKTVILLLTTQFNIKEEQILKYLESSMIDLKRDLNNKK